jgi:hypothetical protein
MSEVTMTLQRANPVGRGTARKLAAGSRRLLRWARAVAGSSPLTLLGLAVLPLTVWLLLVYGLGRQDKVLLAVSVCGLAVLGLSMLGVLLTALCLWLRKDAGEPAPLEFEADVPMRTGFTLRHLAWLPLVKVEWTWERPQAVRVQALAARGGLVEEVTAGERGVCDEVVRRFTVTDVFGLTRWSLRRRTAQHIKVSPAVGAVKALELLPQYDHGDLTAHPEGTPGGDLIEMRGYTAGDPLKQILWKVYARTGQLLVRTPERAVMPCERTLAYLVASPADEPAAGIARAVLESGALGLDFLFGADGAEAVTSDAHEAQELVIRSAGARGQGGEGLARFLALGEADGIRACVLFLPHRPGEWLERVAEQVARHPGPFRVLIGVDGLQAPQRWSLRKLLFRQEVPTGGHPAEVGAVRDRLEQAGAEVTVVDRLTGAVLDPAPTNSHTAAADRSALLAR